MLHKSPWYEKEAIPEIIEYLTKVKDAQIEKIEQIVDVTDLFAQYKL